MYVLVFTSGLLLVMQNCNLAGHSILKWELPIPPSIYDSNPSGRRPDVYNGQSTECRVAVWYRWAAFLYQTQPPRLESYWTNTTHWPLLKIPLKMSGGQSFWWEVGRTGLVVTATVYIVIMGCHMYENWNLLFVEPIRCLLFFLLSSILTLPCTTLTILLYIRRGKILRMSLLKMS